MLRVRQNLLFSGKAKVRFWHKAGIRQVFDLRRSGVCSSYMRRDRNIDQLFIYGFTLVDYLISIESLLDKFENQEETPDAQIPCNN